MNALIIAFVLIIGPDHQLIGGEVLPGASTNMSQCMEKVNAFVEAHKSEVNPKLTVVPACAALKPDVQT